MPEEDKTNERDDDAFLDQFLAQRPDCAVDQFAAVVSRHDPDSSRQRRFDIVDLMLNTIDHVERVLAVTHHYDSTDDFTVAIQVGYAASERAAEMNSADVLYINRCAVFDFEHNVLNVGDVFEITAAAHEIFRSCDFEGFSAHVAVARFHTRHDIA